MAPLKLLAFDHEDLEIISAHLQHASITVKDLIWQAKNKRFVVGLQRFIWEEEGTIANPPTESCRAKKYLSALRFERVLTIRTYGIDRNRAEDKLTLLALHFHADPQNPSLDSPLDQPSNQSLGGMIHFIFSEKAALQLHVDYIEMALTDLSLIDPDVKQ